MPDHQVDGAHADTGDADEDLVPAGFGQVQWLDGERGLRMAQDRGAGVHVFDTPPGSGKRTWRSGLRGRRKSDRRRRADIGGGSDRGYAGFVAIEIGRAHVWTPVTNAQLVCRLLLE